jgi:hypothetical protein
MVADGIATAGLIFLFNSILKGSELSLKECISKAILYFPLFFVTVIVTRLLATGGFLLLIIPGIILSARLSLSKFYFLLTDDGPIEAIKHSLKQTKGYVNAIISTMLVAAIPLIIAFTLFLLGHFIINVHLEFSSFVSIFIFGIILGLYAVFFLIVLFRIFCLLNQKVAAPNNALATDS